MSDDFNFGDQMKLIQDSLNQFNEKAEKVLETGEAGGGLVKVTVNGKMQFTDIEIDPVLLSADQKETLKTLIVSAANNAMQKVREAMVGGTFKLF